MSDRAPILQHLPLGLTVQATAGQLNGGLRRHQKTHYALGLFLHPFGIEKPLLIGQLSSDVADVFVLFLRSRAATIGASFLDFNSFNPYASMHVVFHIYGSLEVQAALNNSAPYDNIFIFGIACKCFCN